MAALPVIEDFDVLKEGRAGRVLGRERLTSEEFALQGGEETLGHGVVIAVADRPHGAADADRVAALPEEQRGVLAAMVGVVNDPLTRPPVPDGHLQRGHDQFGAQVISHGPAHDPATERVQDHGQIQEALILRRHVRASSNPERVEDGCRERALDQVRGQLGLWVALRRVKRAPAMAPDQTGAPHEAREALAPTAHSRVRHFGVDARHARGAAACLMDQADLRNQMLVSLGTRRAPRAAALAPRPLAARGDTQHPAKSDDGMAGLLALHKLVGD